MFDHFQLVRKGHWPELGGEGIIWPQDQFDGPGPELEGYWLIPLSGPRR